MRVLLVEDSADLGQAVREQIAEDGHAVQQINRNIELIRYRRFGDELLLLELANAASANAGKATTHHVDILRLGPLAGV